MAKAAKLTIVEAENIVEVGEIDPNDVHLPGIFVDRIVPSTAEKHIEVLKLRKEDGEKAGSTGSAKDLAQEKRDRIGRRAAEELRDGYYVNLGVGEYRHAAGTNHLQGYLADHALFKAFRLSPSHSYHPRGRFGSSRRTASSGWVRILPRTKSTREYSPQSHQSSPVL